MKRAKISIDYSKCTSPEDCRQCLSVCHPAVLVLTFNDDNFYDPKDWIILPAFPSLCIGCNFCVDQCPEKAISVIAK